MKLPRALVVFVALAVGLGLTWAQEPAKTASERVGEETVDLTKIERKILKKPTYETKKQEYCLLVFGPEAKLRVWLVLDGNTLYVDRNANGDLTDPGERVPIGIHGSFPAGDIDDPFAKTKHLNIVVFPVGKNPATIDIRSAGRYRQRCHPKYGSQPSKAPIIHFNGPVTLKLDVSHERISDFGIGKAGILRRGKDAYVEGHLGTPGLGEHSFAHYWAREHIPGGLTVEFEFPAAEKNLVCVKTKGVLKPDDVMMEGYFPVPEQAKLNTINIKAYVPDRTDIRGVLLRFPRSRFVINSASGLPAKLRVNFAWFSKGGSGTMWRISWRMLTVVFVGLSLNLGAAQADSIVVTDGDGVKWRVFFDAPVVLTFDDTKKPMGNATIGTLNMAVTRGNNNPITLKFQQEDEAATTGVTKGLRVNFEAQITNASGTDWAGNQLLLMDDAPANLDVKQDAVHPPLAAFPHEPHHHQRELHSVCSRCD